MRVGDQVIYSSKKVVTILKIEGSYALIQFDFCCKICTNLHGLKKNDPKADLTVSASGTVNANI